jgi:hypothetical protein
MERLINRSFAGCMNIWLILPLKHNKQICRFEGKRLLIQSYHVPKKILALCAKKEKEKKKRE